MILVTKNTDKVGKDSPFIKTVKRKLFAYEAVHMRKATKVRIGIKEQQSISSERQYVEDLLILRVNVDSVITVE